MHGLAANSAADRQIRLPQIAAHENGSGPRRAPAEPGRSARRVSSVRSRSIHNSPFASLVDLIHQSEILVSFCATAISVDAEGLDRPIPGARCPQRPQYRTERKTLCQLVWNTLATLLPGQAPRPAPETSGKFSSDDTSISPGHSLPATPHRRQFTTSHAVHETHASPHKGTN